jgi:orotate phosphoribosyltransferase
LSLKNDYVCDAGGNIHIAATHWIDGGAQCRFICPGDSQLVYHALSEAAGNRQMTGQVAHSVSVEPRAQHGQRHANADKRLADIIYAKSFGRGTITLASGKESSFYFDMKPSMLNPEGANLIAERVLAELLKVKADFVGGLEMGAVPITGAICQLSFEKGHPIQGFFVRKAPKGHGAGKLIEGLAPRETLKGKRVVVVDDVTTSGDSALKAVTACQNEGGNVVMIISIVDRLEGAAEAFLRRKIEFKALFDADEFLSRG